MAGLSSLSLLAVACCPSQARCQTATMNLAGLRSISIQVGGTPSGRSSHKIFVGPFHAKTPRGDSMQRLRSERIVANPVDTSITAGRTKLPSVRATATMVLSGDQHGDIAPQPTGRGIS